MKEYLEKIILSSIEELFTKDHVLLSNNVSERAITHKLAEYLQKRIPEYHVDCEYNRNYVLGANRPKSIFIVKARSIAEIKKKYKNSTKVLMEQEEYLAEVTSYPDIIVHRRLTNKKNLLIIEVKKSNTPIAYDYDFMKLKAFTSLDQGYKCQFGVFINFNIDEPYNPPEIKWFAEGHEI